jgi:hypothetical protein
MSKFLDEVEEYLRGSGLNQAHKGKGFLEIQAEKRALFFISYEWMKNEEIPAHVYTITEDEWRRNAAAVQSRISSLLKQTNKIHGRSCEVKQISRIEAKKFMNENHIMGYAQSQLHYGLFHKGKLVAAAVFSKGRKMRRLPEGSLSFELVRFCNLNFHTVVGGLSKLIAYFVKENEPGDIITYIDKSWAEPAAYYALGFVNLQELPPIEFLINMKTHERIPVGENQITGREWFSYRNKGTLKLIKSSNW